MELGLIRVIFRGQITCDSGAIILRCPVCLLSLDDNPASFKWYAEIHRNGDIEYHKFLDGFKRRKRSITFAGVKFRMRIRVFSAEVIRRVW